jgi:hypothetical protein
LIRALSTVTRLPPQWAALLIANAFLLAAYWLLFVYVRQRFVGVPSSGGMPPTASTWRPGGTPTSGDSIDRVPPTTSTWCPDGTPTDGTPTHGSPRVERLPV